MDSTVLTDNMHQNELLFSGLKLPNDQKEIFNSRNVNQIVKYLQLHEIKHIVITPEMKRNLWKNEEDGLLFVVENHEDFAKVYDGSAYTIYSFEK